MTEKKTSSKRTNAASELKVKQTAGRKRSSKTTARQLVAGHSADPVAHTVSEEEIAFKAYALWEERGRPFGSPDEDWHKARTELHGAELQS